MWGCPTVPNGTQYSSWVIGRMSTTGSPVDYSRVLAYIPAGGHYRREITLDNSGHIFVTATQLGTGRRPEVSVLRYSLPRL